MTVSVIIPAYRAAGCLPEAVDGVLKQTRQPEEIIIVENKSPDGTFRIAKELQRQ